MNFNQIENVIKISESNSISHASFDLYITQSALNQQLITLEEELGVKLFQRSKSGTTLTEAGKIYLGYAKKLLAIKKELIDVMRDYSNHLFGTVKIGLPTVRGFDMFTNVFPIFYQKYPHIRLEPMELSVKRQKVMVANGNLDIAFMTITEEDKSDDCYEHILDEEIFLAIPLSNPLSKFAPDSEVNLQLFKNEKFVMIYKDSTLRKIPDRLFHDSGIKPDILFETSNHQTISNMVAKGYACAIIPKMYIAEQDKVRFYRLPQKPMWMLCACYKKGAYLSVPVKGVLELAIQYWKKRG